MTNQNISTYGPEFNIVAHPDHPGAADRLAEWAPIIGQAADAGTTILGLRRGYAEANPIAAMVTGNVGVFLGIKLGAGIAGHYLVRNLRESGHPGWARALGWLDFAEGAIPAVLNVRTMRG